MVHKYTAKVKETEAEKREGKKKGGGFVWTFRNRRESTEGKEEDVGDSTVP